MLVYCLSECCEDKERLSLQWTLSALLSALVFSFLLKAFSFLIQYSRRKLLHRCLSQAEHYFSHKIQALEGGTGT